MSNTPEISIITPVYNVEKYLRRCLDSISAQTFPDFEVICINDGSADGSGKILAEYAARDSRIKIIDFPKNRGLCRARNAGIAAARGRFIYFADSDDFLHPQLLEIAHRFADAHTADLVHFNAIDFDGNPATIPLFKTYTDFPNLPHVLTDDLFRYFGKSRRGFQILFPVWMNLYRRDLLSGIDFNSDVLYWEDMIFTARVMKRRPRTVLLRENLYYYVSVPDSISKRRFTAKHIRDQNFAFNFIRDLYRGAPKSETRPLAGRFFRRLNLMRRNISAQPPLTRGELMPLFSKYLSDVSSADWLVMPDLGIGSVARMLRFRRMLKGTQL